MLAAPAAYAAPGDPFPAADPLVFVAQQTPTQLFRAATDAAGNVVFAPEGGPAPVGYNAISYNTADNYLYGIVSTLSGTTAFPDQSLVRIGQGGVLTRVGTGTVAPPSTATSQNVGVFGPDGNLHHMSSASTTMYVTNPTTGANVRTITLSEALNAADLALNNGYLWAISSGTATVPAVMRRVDLATGAVTSFPLPVGVNSAQPYGAAWTFGNGNLGFSGNTTGTVYQIAVANAASANPTFTLVATSDGPASQQNDGAASPGLPTDLSIVKTGPAALIAGDTATYTLTVTNNGPGNSSGFVVNDTVPAPLTNVTSPDAACTVTGNAVQCIGGRLVAGATVTYTITASIPANIASGVANTATVTSNEQDPTPGNNTSTTTAGLPGIGIVKNAGTPVDVNGNGLTDAGDTIQYTFDVTNTGQVPLTGVAVNDPKVGAVTCPQTSLAVGATETCSATAAYTITPADVTTGAVDNTATVTGTTPDGDVITSTPSTTSTPTTAAAPGITIVKSASGPASYTAGEVVTYTFVVTNTGNVPLNTVTVDETAFTGTGGSPAITCPATTIAVGTQLVCTATYTLTAADVNAGTVTNSATATGTPTGSTTPITSTPSTVTIPITPAPALTVLKTVSPSVVALAGQTVEYSFRVTNIGNVTLTGVTIDETAFTGSGTVSAIDCPVTTLASGQFTTCTATYTVTQADVDAGGTVSNTATAVGTPPTGPAVTSTPSTAVVTPTQSPALTVVKTADATVAEVGQVVTYSFRVTNTGNLTITDPEVAEGTFTGSGDLSAIACPAGSLAPGDDVTCTATYTVTQADIDSGAISNTATVAGTTPGGGTTDPSDPSTVIVPTDPESALTVVKTADRQTVTAVGQIVTYSFRVTNTGTATITDPAVTEGAFSGSGTLSPLECAPGSSPLAPDASFVCTATYTVVAADLEAGNLTNTATVSGTTPGGGPITSVPSTATVTNGFAPVPPTPTPAPTPATPATPAVPAAIAGVLAHTGSDGVMPAAGAAVLLMLLGGAFLVVRRRKHHRQHDAA
ncbi:hypothetical protein GCM10027413_05150 [Conyzicola nivalis]|uniref:DUF11 domain-containing protein n=2 Tax=Conyzicola nivalis TaxID=1477021 RepID=A0A916SLC6_9MICO|nr:hypothetical protein GCM10010979_21480 [Conyzicola nivalis]